jgi:hypothetical protein
MTIRTAVPYSLLTRKRSQVQTLSRPPLFLLVSAVSSWRTALRTCRGRAAAAACSPPNRIGPSGAGRHGPTQHNDHGAWSPLPASLWSAITPATCSGRTCGGLVSTCSFSYSQPTDRHPGAGPAPLVGQAANAAPQPVRMRCGGPGLPSTLVRATHCQRTTIPSPPGPIRAATTQPLADHSDTSNPMRPDVGGPAAPTHARIQRGADSADAAAADTGGVSVRTPGSRRSGGHRSRGHQTSARPLDGRPPGGQRTRTGRRMACPASGQLDGHGDGDRRLGWPNPCSGCRVCGAPAIRAAAPTLPGAPPWATAARRSCGA